MEVNSPDNANFPEQRQILDALPAVVFIECDGKIVYANTEARRMLGLTAGEWLPRPIEDVLWGIYPSTSELQAQQADAQRSSPFRATLPSRKGHQYPVEGTYSVFDAKRHQSIIVVNIAGQEHALKSPMMEDVMASLPEAVAIEDSDCVLYINPAFTRMFGFTVAEATGNSMRQLIVPETRLNEHSTLLKAAGEQGSVAVETVRAHRSGELLDVSLQLSPLLVKGVRAGYIYSFRDIGERKQTEARLQHDAMHDVLTGLPNRALFQDHLTLALSRRVRRPEQSCGVLYLDLDRFKEVNDGLGHAAGDVLLKAVADRLSSALRPEDSAARLGGDEFAVLVENITTVADLEVVGNRILAELRRPYEIFGHVIQSGASIGVAVADLEHTSAELLIRDADYAMYRAKQSGGSRLEIYDRHLEVCANSQQERERELRSILENHLFELWYQPIYRLTDGRLEGFEASLAWRRTDGVVEVSRDLMALAEETGLAISLGHEMLENVCMQLRKWSDLLPQSSFFLSMNLPPRLFHQAEFVAQLNRVLAQSGADPLRLVLEVSESTLNVDPDSAVAILQRLVDSRVRVALDEFGSTLAPLNHLVYLPFDILKLDGKLTVGADSQGRQQIMLEALVGLGRAVGMQVIAQGIETPEQLTALVRMGCLSGQGSMLSSPMDAKQALKLATARAEASGVQS